MMMIFEDDSVDVFETIVLCELFDNTIFTSFDIELDKINGSSTEFVFDKVRESNCSDFYRIIEYSVCLVIEGSIGISDIFCIDKKLKIPKIYLYRDA